MKNNIQNELNYVSNPDRYIDIKQDNKIIPTRLSYYASAQAKILGYNNYEDMLKSGHNLDTSESIKLISDTSMPEHSDTLIPVPRSRAITA